MFSQASIDAPKEPVVEETQPLPNVPRAEPTYPDGTPKSSDQNRIDDED